VLNVTEAFLSLKDEERWMARGTEEKLKKGQERAWKQKRVENNLMYERQERIHARNQEGSSSSSSHELHSRGLREDVNDVYSDPLYRVGDLVMILKDTRPGVSYKDSYDTEGKVIVRAELQLLFVIVSFIKRFPTK